MLTPYFPHARDNTIPCVVTRFVNPTLCASIEHETSPQNQVSSRQTRVIPEGMDVQRLHQTRRRFTYALLATFLAFSLMMARYFSISSVAVTTGKILAILKIPVSLYFAFKSVSLDRSKPYLTTCNALTYLFIGWSASSK